MKIIFWHLENTKWLQTVQPTAQIYYRDISKRSSKRGNYNDVLDNMRFFQRLLTQNIT